MATTSTGVPKAGARALRPGDRDRIEDRTRAIGRELFARVGRASRPWRRAWWEDRFMAATLDDPEVRVQLFRFIDVLPALKTASAVRRHLAEYLDEAGDHVPWWLRTAVALAPAGSEREEMLAASARGAAGLMARKFIAGSTPEEAFQTVLKLRAKKVAFTADLLGEAVISEAEADAYQRTCLDLLRGLAGPLAARPEVPQIDRDADGPIPRVNLSLKLSSLTTWFDPISPAGTIARTAERLRPILRTARELGAYVHVDMEQYDYRALSYDLFEFVLSEPDFRDWSDVGIVVQAYQPEAEAELRRLDAFVERRGAPITVRLVKGAYWDYEVLTARRHGWPEPVFLHKWQTDANYERCTRFLMEHRANLRPAVASHNLRSLAHAIAAAEVLGLPIDAYELQTLHGMGEAIDEALVERGCRVRVYTPYGAMLPGMAYLVRRLLENTSNESFLKASGASGVAVDDLLRDPEETGAMWTKIRKRGVFAPSAVEDPSELPPFRNEPVADFARADDRQAMQQALAKVQYELGRHYPLIVDGEPIDAPIPASESPSPKLKFAVTDFPPRGGRQTAKRSDEGDDRRGVENDPSDGRPAPIAPSSGPSGHLPPQGGKAVDRAANLDGTDSESAIVPPPRYDVSIDPSHLSRVVGYVSRADASHADQAIAAARAALPGWSATPPAERAAVLVRAAALMRDRKFELSAWEVYECGKPWREADADVAEAIDFCEFYAREMIRLAEPRRRDVPGETNVCDRLPRGVAVVIPPWNFPLAIPCGMTVGPLVAGCPVILKPAEQSPIVASKLMEILLEAGLPKGVLQYLPGEGEVVGQALVHDPRVAVVSFTGSRTVGLLLNRQAAETPKGQDHVKKVIAEMGGKNAIIVDDDADLDEAVVGVLQSAFGYAGQKCSACSRAVVLEGVYDAFVARLTEAGKSLRVGPAEDPDTYVGPVIDADARKRILEYRETAKSEGRVVLDVDVSEIADRGTFVGPLIVADVKPDARIAQEEIFGPVLAVIKAKDLDDALTIAEGTAYALTGGLYSRSPVTIERVRRDLRVGDLYINRAITGALVDRQPFGGFKLSGVGAKAGGSEYLLEFLLTRSITENTMRRGFAPEEPTTSAEGE